MDRQDIQDKSQKQDKCSLFLANAMNPYLEQFTLQGHCCPGTVGFLELRFENRVRMAILRVSDPDNENQVAIDSRLRTTITTVYFV